MVRRNLILGTIAAAIVVSACRGTANRVEAPGRPNILVILLDDLRWDALGYAGHPHLRTPQIDRIANEGVNFRNAFSTTSLCSAVPAGSRWPSAWRIRRRSEPSTCAIAR